MKKQLFAFAFALVAGFAHAELVWDSVVSLPAIESGEPGEYAVCPPETYFRSVRGELDREGCYRGSWLRPRYDSKPKRMGLQSALELYRKAPAGQRFLALGPLPTYDRLGVRKDQIAIAYKWIRVPTSGLKKAP